MKNWRINLIFALIFLFGAAIIGRLVFIQIIEHNYYRALAQGQQKVFQFAKGERGEIFLSDNRILAVNVKEKRVFLSPLEIEEKEKTAEILSRLFNLEKEQILEIIKRKTLFEKLDIVLDDESYNNLKNENLKGVHVSEEVFRKYPQELMAASVIGFLGGQGDGQYGIEGYYNEILQGNEYLWKFGTERKYAKGSDIFLTIDYNIQFTAEKLLRQAKKDLNIKAGQIIVMDPRTGKILALADFPDFNPNEYQKVNNFQIFQNSAVQELFEPGSVFKAITMAAALDQGKITPQTTYLDEGKVVILDDTIYNYNERAFGLQTMTQVLEKSINTGAVFAERQLGHNLFLDYIKRFGFLEPTGIDLQGEVFSENREIKRGYEVNFSAASFGQGIEMTPIQLIRAFSVIANGGKLVRPYVVDRISGKEITEPKISKERIISQKTASQLTAMLVSVIENGFSKGAKVPGYYIAGKTGTAQVSFSALGINKKGYSDETWQSFIGFGPAFDSKFIILVKLDSPETKTAEYSALPIFHELAKYIIDYLEIPPDYD